MSDLGQQLIAIVRRKASEQPGFIYDPGGAGTCMYVHPDGQPGCLIGQALLEAGVIDSTFFQAPTNTATIRELAEALELPLDPNEVKWLREAQRGQDQRDPWAGAVQVADEIYGALYEVAA